MSQLYNIPARTQRNSDVGLVWEEKMSGAIGVLELQRYQAFRVRSTGALTVEIGGILAATMIDGEILTFNTGIGNEDDTKKTVTIRMAGAGTAFVQVGREKERKKTT